jgi:hypothetical protein
MTLQTILADIENIAATKLAALGLKAVANPTDDPMSEDHAIEFRDARDRVHAVRLQVNSYAPSWSSSSMVVTHIEMKPIAGTTLFYAEPGWSHPQFESTSVAGRIKELLTAIADHNWFEPEDDVVAGVVTDFRMETVIPKLLETFEGDIKLSRTAAEGPVDTVEIVDEGGNVEATLRFSGPSDITLAYRTILGNDRTIKYDCLKSFNQAIDADLGRRPANGPGNGNYGR